MALSKDEMDFVVQLLDRRSMRPIMKLKDDDTDYSDIVDKWIEHYYLKDTTVISPVVTP